MSPFLSNAQTVLDAASSGTDAVSDGLVILLGGEGGVRIVVGSDWPLHSLVRERGAAMGYRVHKAGDTIRVEGDAGTARCLLEARTPQAALLADSPRYRLHRSPNFPSEGAPSTTALPRAGTGRLLPAAWG